MKRTNYCLLLALALALGAFHAAAQGTAFTYQGALNDGPAAATGSYDLTFTVFDAATDGNVIAGPLTNSAVEVTNGLFTTTVDFGAGVFAGAPYWLEIGVETNGSTAGFLVLSPRQQITPVPYAIYSSDAAHAESATTADQATAVLDGAVSVSQLNTTGTPAAGQVLGFDGTELVWQDPILGGSTGGWSLNGNVGTVAGLNFLGTSDSQPLELKVAGARALRLEPDTTGNSAPNVIGGSVGNYVSGGTEGATIAGGGGVPGLSNVVTSAWGTIAGGAKNLAGGQYTFVGSGYDNAASGYIATVAGGAYNIASTNESAVLGGAFNIASGIGSVVGGGGWDGVSASGNLAAGSTAFIGAGVNNKAGGYGAAIGAGGGNNASAEYAFIGGGSGNVANGNDAILYFFSRFSFAYITGDCTIGGGFDNVAGATGATVPGGAFNTAAGDFSLACGYHANAATEGSFVWADDSSTAAFSSSAVHQFLVRASGGVGVNTNAPGATLDVCGGAHISGPLTVGDNFDATIGCADLLIGFSGRRGSPGRALTDFGTSLNINCCGDWATTYVGGGNVSVCTLTIRGGCDLAEPFTTSEEQIEPGSVVVIDSAHPGQLKLSATAYDTHVAGVISGANGINPGIALHQEGAMDGGQNVALTGRVYVMADTSNGAIEPGDLLTTSSEPGCAMKVTDHARAQGAILGKAMGTLNQGTGMVLVLVTLQ